MAIIVGGSRWFDHNSKVRTYPLEGEEYWPRGVGDPVPVRTADTDVRLDVLPPSQQQGGTCYAYTMVHWLRMLARRDGVDLPTPSASWFGFLGRYIDTGGDESLAKLRASMDWGSHSRSVVLAAQIYGVASVVDWSDALDHFGRFAPWVERVRADARRVELGGLLYCRSMDDVATCLTVYRSPVMVSIPIHTEINGNDGSKTLTGSGVYLGGHACNVVGMRTIDGAREWLLQMTWGECGLERKGLFWASDAYMSAWAQDKWGCTKLVMGRA